MVSKNNQIHILHISQEENTSSKWDQNLGKKKEEKSYTIKNMEITVAKQ